MLEPFRSDFNARFTPAKYQRLLTRLNEATETEIEFRVCETPCFFSKELLNQMAKIGAELTHQLVDNQKYMAMSEETVPEGYRVPGTSAHPNFMTVDFGLTRDHQGVLQPKLVELQAFPSIYGYQSVSAPIYKEIYGLDPDLQWLFSGMDDARYWQMLGDVILGGHAPEHVVLMEIEPEQQKTLPDFHIYQQRLGIKTVDVTLLRKEGKQLFYERDGKWTRIKRIYNRAIVDEMERKQIAPSFDYRAEIDVEWAGHPNWYFRISKFSLPFLEHASVPKTAFLDDWFAGRGAKLPEEREQLLLKPLYSFAGRGIQFAPSDEDLAEISVTDRHLYLLQERIHFEPVIETPHGRTQAEVRIMYLWPDGGDLVPVTSLVRLGRGLMMGVDHNKRQEWVGGSTALFPSGN